MQWTKDQSQAIDDILEWSLIPDSKRLTEDRFYTLQGAAGTGKSTVVLEIINKAFSNKRVVVSAPTHTAKDVISEMTNKDGYSVHSLLGLRPNVELETFDPHNPTYNSMAKMKLPEYDVIIVDECSMINKALFKALSDAVIDYNKLLIFVGDAIQLPPINEKISKTFLLKNKSVLEEIVRQKGSNPNHVVLKDAREDAEKQAFELDKRLTVPDKHLNINKDGRVQGFIITKDKEVFYEKLIELYSDSEAKTNMHYIKTLTYDNRAVENLNSFIKARINPSEAIITEGDYLLGYNTTINPNNNDIVVQNGKEYFVHFIKIVTKKIYKENFKFFRVTADKYGKTIDILHPDSYELFHTMVQNLYNNGINNRKWRPFYAFKENFITMKNFYHDELLDKYGKPQLICKKDIDLGYAMTVHKSQGSTYDNVAVIYSNIKRCYDSPTRKSLAYVALSRTRYLNLIYI